MITLKSRVISNSGDKYSNANDYFTSSSPFSNRLYFTGVGQRPSSFSKSGRLIASSSVERLTSVRSPNDVSASNPTRGSSSWDLRSSSPIRTRGISTDRLRARPSGLDTNFRQSQVTSDISSNLSHHSSPSMERRNILMSNFNRSLPPSGLISSNLPSSTSHHHGVVGHHHHHHMPRSAFASSRANSRPWTSSHFDYFRPQIRDRPSLSSIKSSIKSKLKSKEPVSRLVTTTSPSSVASSAFDDSSYGLSRYRHVIKFREHHIDEPITKRKASISWELPVEMATSSSPSSSTSSSCNSKLSTNETPILNQTESTSDKVNENICKTSELDESIDKSPNSGNNQCLTRRPSRSSVRAPSVPKIPLLEITGTTSPDIIELPKPIPKGRGKLLCEKSNRIQGKHILGHRKPSPEPSPSSPTPNESIKPPKPLSMPSSSVEDKSKKIISKSPNSSTNSVTQPTVESKVTRKDLKLSIPSTKNTNLSTSYKSSNENKLKGLQTDQQAKKSSHTSSPPSSQLRGSRKSSESPKINKNKVTSPPTPPLTLTGSKISDEPQKGNLTPPISMKSSSLSPSRTNSGRKATEPIKKVTPTFLTQTTSSPASSTKSSGSLNSTGMFEESKSLLSPPSTKSPSLSPRNSTSVESKSKTSSEVGSPSILSPTSSKSGQSTPPISKAVTKKPFTSKEPSPMSTATSIQEKIESKPNSRRSSIDRSIKVKSKTLSGTSSPGTLSQTSSRSSGQQATSLSKSNPVSATSSISSKGLIKKSSTSSESSTMLPTELHRTNSRSSSTKSYNFTDKIMDKFEEAKNIGNKQLENDRLVNTSKVAGKVNEHSTRPETYEISDLKEKSSSRHANINNTQDESKKKKKKKKTESESTDKPSDPQPIMRLELQEIQPKIEGEIKLNPEEVQPESIDKKEQITEKLIKVQNEVPEAQLKVKPNENKNNELTKDNRINHENEVKFSSGLDKIVQNGRLEKPMIEEVTKKQEKKRIRFRPYTIDDFDLRRVLGRGSFGKVYLAQLKEHHDKYFAIKFLKKHVVIEDDDLESILIERKVLALGVKHPFICKLFCTFQTKGLICFVMEFLAGGDLMFHVQSSGKFSEDRGRFYAAEIVSALNFLHSRYIIYRDLKLDNILLDAEGHIRLVDFGMCQCHIWKEECLPSNFCGTPEYMAPEIIKGVQYNQSVDWWSFGVLLFEMLVGDSPFKGTDEDELLWNVCYEKVRYPRFLSRNTESIISLCLERDPVERLGMPTCSKGDIRCHPFFDKINWDAINAAKIKPPFKPELKHSADTCYFDREFTEMRPVLTPIDDYTAERVDHELFRGFDYTNPHMTD